MSDDRFKRPVAFKVGEGRAARFEQILGVNQGFDALHLGTLGDFRLDRPEWQIAFDRLVKAKLDPTPDNVEEAREALALLAGADEERA